MAFITTSSASSRGSKFSLTRLTQAFAVLRQRRQLSQLDATALRDMGLTQTDVDCELSRSAWDVPANWRG
jgi:uncharacterized protein YjiS (DUF1127 family)